MYRSQHWAEREMTGLAQRFARAGGLQRRALQQAGRELLLMQSSDWAFIVTTGTTAPYAVRRFKRHFQNFQALHAALMSGTLDEAEISAREGAMPIFADLDCSGWM
jgi:1,4-alpha-glucan branching enzyme